MAIRKRADTGRWQAQIKNPVTGRRQSKDFDRKVDAVDWVKWMTAAEVTGTSVRPGAGRVTVADLWPTYLGTLAGRKASHRRTVESKYRTHVAPKFGPAPVEKITRTAVLAWVAELGEQGKAASTIRQAVFILAGILQTAVDDRMLAVNPAKDLGRGKLPKPAVRDHVFLDAGQVAALVAAGRTEQDRLILSVLSYTGVRIGEALALQVGDLDPVRGTVTVRRSVSDLGGQLVVDTPKSDRWRTVGAPAALLARLAAHVAGRERADLVFPSRAGTMLQLGNWRRSFDAAVRRAGLAELGLTPHSLRAAFTSLAVESGLTVKDVQTQLGHQSPAVTLGIYARASNVSAAKVGAAMGSVASVDPACNWNATGGSVSDLQERRRQA